MKAQQASDTTNLDDLKALRSDLGATVNKYNKDSDWLGLPYGLGDDANKFQQLYASVITDSKNKVDALSVTQQLQMIFLQGVNNKRDQTFNQLTTSISNEGESKENIL